MNRRANILMMSRKTPLSAKFTVEFDTVGELVKKVDELIGEYPELGKVDVEVDLIAGMGFGGLEKEILGDNDIMVA